MDEREVKELMTHDEITSFLNKMPSTVEKRIVYAQKVMGQLFGWIAGPDQEFLIEFLPQLAKKFDHPIDIVEIGVFGGSTSRGLIALTGGHLTGIDNWAAFQGEGQRSLNQFTCGEEFFWWTLKNAGPDLSHMVKRLITGNSQDIGQTWNEPIDLLLIDGDHSFDAAKNDMRLFCPHVVLNGVVLVDDYEMGTVRTAADEYFDDGHWERIKIPNIAVAKIFCIKRIG